MGWALVRKSDGRLDGGWFRYDRHQGFDANTHEEVQSAEPPGEFDFWNGSAFVPMAQEDVAAIKAAVIREESTDQFSKKECAVLRAIVLSAMDEINLLRAWITNFKAAVAGAATLPTLKAAVGELPNVPQRTAAQAKSAIEAKIESGDAD